MESREEGHFLEKKVRDGASARRRNVHCRVKGAKGAKGGRGVKGGLSEP